MRTNRKTLRSKNKLGNIQMLNCKSSLFKCLKLGLITNGGLDMQDLMIKPEQVGNAIKLRPNTKQFGKIMWGESMCGMDDAQDKIVMSDTHYIRGDSLVFGKLPRARLGYEPVALSAENAIKYEFK